MAAGALPGPSRAGPTTVPYTPRQSMQGEGPHPETSQGLEETGAPRSVTVGAVGSSWSWSTWFQEWPDSLRLALGQDSKGCCTQQGSDELGLYEGTASFTSCHVHPPSPQYSPARPHAPLGCALPRTWEGYRVGRSDVGHGDQEQLAQAGQGWRDTRCSVPKPGSSRLSLGSQIYQVFSVHPPSPSELGALEKVWEPHRIRQANKIQQWGCSWP